MVGIRKRGQAMSRKNRYLRSKPTRSPLPTATCAVEGDNTEPEYLFALANDRQLGKRFKIEPSHSEPLSVVKKLVAAKKECARKREHRDYWIAVFDTEFSEQRKQAIARARNLARNNGILCFESNPAFEFWLKLHFSKDDRPYGSQNDLERDLQRFLPDYSKEKGYLLRKMNGLIAKVGQACENATWVQAHSDFGNSTDMPELVKIIDGMAHR